MISEKQVKRYCKEDISNIENYDKAIADTSQTWECHHRTEIWWNCSMQDLIDNECYYNRKACELIFLTPTEHSSLHKKGKLHPMYGKHHSTETKQKISESQKGKTLSEETKRKISKSHKSLKASDETRRRMSKARKGKSHASNGGYKHSDEWKAKAKEREHKKSAFYQKFGMTIEEYRKYNDLTCSCSAIRRMFKKGEI